MHLAFAPDDASLLPADFRMRARFRDALRSSRLPALPLLWLVAFFGLPFLVVVKISLSDPATALPPYTPVLDWDAGLAGGPTCSPPSTSRITAR